MADPHDVQGCTNAAVTGGERVARPLGGMWSRNRRISASPGRGSNLWVSFIVAAVAAVAEVMGFGEAGHRGKLGNPVDALFLVGFAPAFMPPGEAHPLFRPVLPDFDATVNRESSQGLGEGIRLHYPILQTGVHFMGVLYWFF